MTVPPSVLPSVNPAITLTGAGGALGRILRPGLLAAGYHLRSLDLFPLDPLSPDEQALTGDLQNPALIDRALEGQSAVLHFAGTSVERPLPEITANNLTALHALYEGARRHAVPRIVLASSNHAFGMHDAAEPLTAASPYRPDGLYGLSKMWGEGMARLYWDKHGIETVSLRIGSALDRPTERRHLVTWLGHHDLLHLVLRSLQARTVGFLPVWGISANTRARWTDDAATILAYHPTQNAEDHAPAIETVGPAHRHIGGSFADHDATRAPPPRCTLKRTKENSMVDISQIHEHAPVIGADGVHLGTVDHIDGDRLKLTKTDSSDGQHHYIAVGLIADIEDGTVRLSANADAALLLEEDD